MADSLDYIPIKEGIWALLSFLQPRTKNSLAYSHGPTIVLEC
jgi:hypothetical protein